MFSFETSSALIDFRIFVNELISFAFASTSFCVVVLAEINDFASFTNFSAFSICDFCFSFERIRLISVSNAVTFSCNLVVWRGTTGFTSGVWGVVVSSFFSSTDGAAGLVSIAFSVSTGVETLAFPVSTDFSVTISSLLGVLSPVGLIVIFLSSKTVFLTFTKFSVAVTSLASTWYPKKNPAPTNTLAAPTFNFLIEYFSNFRPDFCWFK